MNRRQFLQFSTSLSAGALCINNTFLQAFASPSMINDCIYTGDRVLVLIQLDGGNDGLNTLIPLDQHALYSSLRPNIGIPSNDCLDLNGDGEFGFHPAMTALSDVYNAGKLSIIQRVGYPNQNKSHFKATDLWLTGGDTSPENFNLTSGWMGRYLNHTYPDIITNPTVLTNPDAIMLDPLGIEMGDGKVSIGFSAAGTSAGINLGKDNGDEFYNSVTNFLNLGASAPPILPVSSAYQHTLNYLINVHNSTDIYANRLKTVFDNGTNTVGVNYPANNALANQLQTVARLISGGCQTKIYLLNIGGFDTHAEQIEATSPLLGTHATLLQELSEAIRAFQEDLLGLGLDHRVLGCTFSEFGRQVQENGSLGTDHGSINPMFVFGTPVQGGIVGANPSLSNLDNQNALSESERLFDYRQVYTTLLQDWLGASNEAVGAAAFDGFLATKLTGLIQPAWTVSPEAYINTYTDATATNNMVRVQARVVLEGAYNSATVSMNTQLLDNNLLPLSQPYNTAPWHYAGAETFIAYDNIPANSVDWVLVELRAADNDMQTIDCKAALLRNDGVLIHLDGTEGVPMCNVIAGEDYYVIVRHRNHIAIMSNTPINLPNSSMLNLLNPDNVRGNTTQLKVVSTTPLVHAMLAGDYNADGANTVADFNRFNSDKMQGTVHVYSSGDGNLNGHITTNDFNVYVSNQSKMGIMQVRY